ncbi:hypothetical protein J4Q44_G00361080 [Coregonus suidteri]|uniref:DUF1977 domain-containing protein n=1 Tax=Coregonus suidteri TaxID=861788 RepID=A0AAN8QLB1_9TELE
MTSMVRRAQPTRQQHRHQRHDFEADISSEDLYNMFFGGGFPSQMAECTLAISVEQDQKGENSRIQMMVTPPPYSLNHRSGTGHIHRRQTQTLKVPYYVGASFTEQYSGKDLRSVEEDYISNLSNNCWNEKQQKEGLLYRACYFGDSDLFQRAQRMGTPSCSRLSEIQITIQG